MNFLQICQRVFDEGDRAPYTISTVEFSASDTDINEQIYKVSNWVKQAYREVQLWNQDFLFHQVIDGALVTTEADVEDYKKQSLRKSERLIQMHM